jgi:magnesium-transporting ATPase (P-type)
MLAHADLLVRRTGARSGALDGLLGAVRTARAIERNMALMLQYMLVTQFLRMTPVLVALLFGNLSLSAPLILAGGLWVDLGFILLLAFRRGGEEELLISAKSERLFESPIRERPDRVIGAALCGVVILLLRLILRNSLLLTPGADVTFVFLSLLTVQTTAILLFYFGGNEKDSRPLTAQLPVLGTLLLILLLPLLLLCSPQIAALCSCAPITLPILAAALVQALIYPALCYGCAALRVRGLRTKR